MMTSDRPESPWPATKISPKIVEYQVGSSDITQSTDANVIVRTYDERAPAR